MFASWRAKLLATVAAVSLICGQISAAIDDDPKTNVDIPLIISVISGLGAAFAVRDNAVTSEQVKAKR